MSEIEVRILKLEPMRVATVWGFGQEPEIIAYNKLDAWAGPKGLRDDPGLRWGLVRRHQMRSARRAIRRYQRHLEKTRRLARRQQI